MTSRTARVLGGATVVLTATLLLASCATPGGAGDAPTPAAATTTTAAAPAPSAATPDASPSAAAAEEEGQVVVTPAPAGSSSAAPAPVTPFVTSAQIDGSGLLEVSAIVPEIVERGGACTLDATSGSTTRSVTVGSAAAASSTGCEPMSISGLAAGTWSVTVRYASADSAGTSAARSVTAG